jgi:beta-glucanase (GH16 family)
LPRFLLALSVLPLLFVSADQQPASTANKNYTLVWHDEFDGPNGSLPDPKKWTYDLGGGGWGNQELESYTNRAENARIENGNLIITARKEDYAGSDSIAREYTSARLKTQGLFSQAYGRFEARIKIPAGQGVWPAFWMLGDNIKSVDWPACREMDIMETVGTNTSTNFGSIHGTGFTGTAIGTRYKLANNAKFSDGFHTFGILWSPKQVKYYVDDPKNVYATYTQSGLPRGAVWPFDTGKFFFILNLAVGGYWPGSPDATSIFPQEMLVDYVRVYAEPGDSSARTTAAARK